MSMVLHACVDRTFDHREIVRVQWERPEATDPVIITTFQVVEADVDLHSGLLPVGLVLIACYRLDSGEVIALTPDELVEVVQAAAQAYGKAQAGLEDEFPFDDIDDEEEEPR